MIKPLVFVLVILVAAKSAEAGECGIDRDIDGIAREIRQASGCRQASHIAQNCAFGSSGDLSLTAAVIEVCEKDFLAGLDRRRRAIYAQQRADCRSKHRHQIGTMYRSFEGFCEARVSERFAQAARKRSSP